MADRVSETAGMDTEDPEKSLLCELVRRIVRAASPERIIHFGSAVEGRRGPDSDFDVLVVKAGTYRRIEVMHSIRRELRGYEAAVDLVVITPDEPSPCR